MPWDFVRIDFVILPGVVDMRLVVALNGRYQFVTHAITYLVLRNINEPEPTAISLPQYFPQSRFFHWPTPSLAVLASDTDRILVGYCSKSRFISSRMRIRTNDEADTPRDSDSNMTYALSSGVSKTRTSFVLLCGIMASLSYRQYSYTLSHSSYQNPTSPWSVRRPYSRAKSKNPVPGILVSSRTTRAVSIGLP